MTKESFLEELNRRLSNRPDKNDIVSFYYEQITDRLEDGESEAEIFADINIEEIISSLNDTDIPEKENVSMDIHNPIIYKDNKQEEEKKAESKHEENKTANNNTTSSATLSGGRKFWYVVWFIATILFCIAAVGLEIGAVCTTISFISMVVAGCTLFTASLGGALFLIGLGLLLLGGGIIAIHFTSVLRKYVFRNRVRWNTYIYNKLGGTK